jgi:hypothetical protein
MTLRDHPIQAPQSDFVMLRADVRDAESNWLKRLDPSVIPTAEDETDAGCAVCFLSSTDVTEAIPTARFRTFRVQTSAS